MTKRKNGNNVMNNKAISALEKAIEENHELRNENALITSQLEKFEEQKRVLMTELSDLKKTVTSQKKTILKLSHDFEVLETRYDALSHSKLGRLTLYFWAKQADVPKNKRGFKTTKAIDRFFSTIPETSDLHRQLGIEETKSETTQLATDQQLHWFDQYDKSIKEMPVSNGIRFYEKLNLKIAIICDQFFYDSIYSSAEFVYLTPENWRENIDNGIDVFLFVTAWKGLHDEWKGLAALSNLNSSKKKIVIEIINYCKSKKIPSIFYSKEDPPNYELFLEIAKHSDYIFTSAKECVHYYKDDCHNDKVQSAMFGINPTMHNPIGIHSDKKSNIVLFSGSWMKKYPERCQELSLIFDGILSSQYKLHIIDRNLPQNMNYLFPEPYFEYSSPAVEHDVLQKLHKQFNWAVNINSVKTSETMFANRGFELSANGILMLSNYSVGVNSVLPNILMVHEKQEAELILNNMTEEDIYEHQIFSIRSVMTEHTCFNRISEILSYTDIHAEQPVRKILVIIEKIDDTFEDNFSRQSYPYKEYILQCDLSKEKIDGYDMITWFSGKAYYGEFYLEDMINAFKYTSCDFITKDAWISKGKLHKGIEHNYVKAFKDKSRTVFWREAFTSDSFISGNIEKLSDNGYSIDHFSYDEYYVKRKVKKKKYQLSVVVPIYNNGNHLYGKCFTSLKRSSIFSQMEIIFVDDGSTDDATKKIESYIATAYDNVKIYQFQDNGSGSASRPRNKGVELATAEYITFLDPDNEAVNDGYALMLKMAKSGRLELVFGNMLKCSDKTSVANNYEKILKVTQRDLFDNGFEHNLAAINFLSISIQAMVIKKSLITDNKIEQVVGAAGQDTLFSWQIIELAKKIKIVDIPIHVYYAQTSGSVTNQVKPKFFEKLLLLQKPKLEWLVENHYIDDFMKLRYDYYTVNWILKKLCDAENISVCVPVVNEILSVYAGYYHHTDEIINRFVEFCADRQYEQAGQYILSVFPHKSNRPMPTIEEIMENSRKNSVMNIVCTQDGGQIMFQNNTECDTGSTYTWVILLAEGAYQKVYSGSYSKENTFIYDFSKLSPQVYKVRAFIRNSDNTKKSEDVAFIRVNADTSVDFMVYESKAEITIKEK